MADLPTDLTVLPTMPYAERPGDLPLDVEECRTAIWLANGNVSKAAETLKVSSARLRLFVKNSAYLTAEATEAKERLKDRAEEVVREGLYDEAEKYTMARYVLSGLGKDRGFSANPSKGLSIDNKGGTVVIQWADGSNINGEEPKTIEGEVVDA